jgi:lipopolysaccharide transport system ATP-binding protein
VLFVSHNMPTLLSLCKEALLLRAGQLVDKSSASHIVQQYLASEIANSTIPLDERRDRSGDGSARLVALRIESTEPGGMIRSGSRLKLVLDYRSAAPVRRPQFVVSIRDQMDIGLFVLHNEMGGGLPEHLPARGSVTCLTDPINLTPGRCVVDVEFLKGNVRADYISFAVSFDVEPDDTPGAGVLPRAWAKCLLRNTWRLNDC